jgi:hypothetical protein
VIISTASGLSAYILYKMTFDAELKVTVHISPPPQRVFLINAEVDRKDLDLVDLFKHPCSKVQDVNASGRLLAR